MNPISFRTFFVPGTVWLETRYMTTDEGMFVGYTARYNDIPTQSPSSSFPACYSNGNCNNISMENIKSGQEFSGYGLIDGTGVNISKSNAGWLYYYGTEVRSGAAGIEFTIRIDAKTYNDWVAHSGSNADGSINWEKDVESVITYGATPTPSASSFPTGPDCDQKVCLGNSCWNGTAYVPGIKTADCASGSATANPATITAPNSAFLTWTSQNASKMEAACLSGPVIVERGGWFTSDAECKTSGLVSDCTDKGYEFKFKENQAGTEICTLYPTNTSDGLPGTPFLVKIEVNNKSTCGNNIVEGTGTEKEECDYTPSSGAVSYVPCPEGKTCQDCKCVMLNKANNYTCQPDNPGCEKTTCKNVKCDDGCNEIQGLADCDGLN
jgi:hypothetical protein